LLLGLLAEKDGEMNEQSRQTLNNVAPNFVELAHGACLARFEYLTKIKGAAVSVASDWDQMVYGPKMALILIAGKDFRLTLKTHYKPKSFSQDMNKNIARDRVNDMFREYCNLVAGAIKQPLISEGIVCGISLPTVTSGYDELVFSDRLRGAKLKECFEVGKEEAKIVITLNVETSDSVILEKLQGVKTEVLIEEEIDFL
jgi:hypothetical protein